MQLVFTCPCPTPPKPPGLFTLGVPPGHWGVCGWNLRAGALDLLGVSQAFSVAMETCCLWPQRLPQDLRPLTQALAPVPCRHSQRQGRPRRARSERRRERE